MLYHLYAIDEPVEAWIISISFHSRSAKIDSYRMTRHGERMWQVRCDGSGAVDQLITLTTSVSGHDCEEAISLMSAELSDFCFDVADVDADFEATMDTEEAPTACEYDCAHL